MAVVHVPYTVDQDEDGTWCAHAWLGSSGGANGNGATRDEAVTDLLEAVQMVLDEDGVPAQLANTLDLEVALCRQSRRSAGTSSSGRSSAPPVGTVPAHDHGSLVAHFASFDPRS